MDEIIVNTWKELVFENPDLEPNEIIEKVQLQFHISYADVISAISKELDKEVTV